MLNYKRFIQPIFKKSYFFPLPVLRGFLESFIYGYILFLPTLHKGIQIFLQINPKFLTVNHKFLYNL